MKTTMPGAPDDDDSLEGSDGVPSDLDLNLSDDDEDKGDEEEKEGDDVDALALAEASDNEDLVSLGAEVPDGLIEYDGTAEDEWGGVDSTDAGKKRKGKNSEEQGRRKKLKSLPTFASYEEYAKLIEDGPEDDI